MKNLPLESRLTSADRRGVLPNSHWPLVELLGNITIQTSVRLKRDSA